MSTGIVWDKRYLLHETGSHHPERPARLQAIGERLKTSPVGKKVTTIEPRPATHEEIALVHSMDYIQQIDESKGQMIQLDPDTISSPKSYEAALLAAGGLLTSVDQVVGGSLTNAFAFVRPPGHHAEHDHAMGFCLFNNVAIAAEYARKKHGLEKIFIMDFDVHHGNGTQWAFYDRSDVYYCSTHRYPFYPGTGGESEEGEGKGQGYTQNIVMQAGCGDLEYDAVFEKKVLPTATDFNPDLILVSAGFDAHERDPLGGMRVSAEGFARMTAGLLKVASQTCRGRLVAVLEGGYDLVGLADSVEATLSEMIIPVG